MVFLCMHRCSLNELSTTPTLQAKPQVCARMVLSLLIWLRRAPQQSVRDCVTVQVYDLRTLQHGSTAVHSLVTPVKGANDTSANSAGSVGMMEPMSAFSVLETAGKQDEVIPHALPRLAGNLYIRTAATAASGMLVLPSLLVATTCCNNYNRPNSCSSPMTVLLPSC